MDEWLSLSQAAKQLGVHPSTVRAWADHGYLPSQRTQGGYRKMDSEAREQYRLSGRSLVQGLVGHLTTSDDGLEAEARSLGYEYASRGQRVGLTSVEAAHAFQFFRTAVMDSILVAYENADVRSPQIWADLLRKINSFSDQIMITLLDTYEALQHTPR
jgi:excisionase family DNA binding protein